MKITSVGERRHGYIAVREDKPGRCTGCDLRDMPQCSSMPICVKIIWREQPWYWNVWDWINS